MPDHIPREILPIPARPDTGLLIHKATEPGQLAANGLVTQQ